MLKSAFPLGERAHIRMLERRRDVRSIADEVKALGISARSYINDINFYTGVRHPRLTTEYNLDRHNRSRSSNHDRTSSGNMMFIKAIGVVALTLLSSTGAGNLLLNIETGASALNFYDRCLSRPA